MGKRTGRSNRMGASSSAMPMVVMQLLASAESNSPGLQVTWHFIFFFFFSLFFPHQNGRSRAGGEETRRGTLSTALLSHGSIVPVSELRERDSVEEKQKPGCMDGPFFF